MAGINFTLRLEKGEMKALEAHAEALGRPRADVVRLALQGLSNSQKNLEALEGLRLDFSADIREASERQSIKLRRVALLILKVLSAPKEAEDALSKIFES